MEVAFLELNQLFFSPQNAGISLSWQPIKSQKWGVESLQSSANNSQQLTLWDGATTGTKTPDGTYYYIISYTKLSGETETLKGYMNLWR